MSVKVTLDGFDELRKALLALPAELTAGAAEIVQNSAEEAVAQSRAGYPGGPTGNLKRGIRVAKSESTRFIASAQVLTAPHGHLYEWGTKRRSYKGANRGVMPKAPEGAAIIPKIIRTRHRMMLSLMAFVRGHGFEVEG